MTLSDAQAAFRQSPGHTTALAYMDAAIEEWERGQPANAMRDALQEIRDWLMNTPIADPEDDYADRAEWRARR